MGRKYSDTSHYDGKARLVDGMLRNNCRKILVLKKE